MKIRLILILIALIVSSSAYSQNDRTSVGVNQLFNQTGAFYNFADKDKVNIEVGVWGYVKFPGKYVIPKGTNIQDLMSYAGGPTVDARLENMRLFRPKNDTLFIKENTLIKLDYNDLFWEDNVNPKTKLSPELLPGDILIFPGEPRLFFRDNLALILSVSSTLISLAILVVSIINVTK